MALLECTNPVLGKWRVRWGVEAKEDGSATYMEEELDHRPDADEIRSLVSEWYNSRTDERILSGFEYDGQPVWLSSENQFNGTDNVPYYKTFDTVADLQDFYVKAMKHIQNALSEGWMKKGALDLALYEVG